MKVNSYDTFLKFYQVVSNPNKQQKEAVFKRIQNFMQGYILSIMTDNKVSIKLSMMTSSLNANAKILHEHIAGLSLTETFEFDSEALKSSLIKEYHTYQGEDEDSEDEEDVSAESMLSFLKDRAAETVTGKITPLTKPQSMTDFFKNYRSYSKDAGYEYNRDIMGLSSDAIKSVLEGPSGGGSNHPCDADDISRCTMYIQKYLKARGREALSEREKLKISALSPYWRGIMAHIDTLTKAVDEKMPPVELNPLLKRCMNTFLKPELTSEEQTKFDQLMDEIEAKELKSISIKDFSLNLANAIVQAMHDKGYFVSLHFENIKDSKGAAFLSHDGVTHLLQPNQLYHDKVALSFSEQTSKANEPTIYAQATL